MSDSIVPNPPFLKQLQALDPAEIAIVRNILMPRPSIWFESGSWLVGVNGWQQMGTAGPQMTVQNDQEGHLSPDGNRYFYTCPADGYYHYDLQFNGNFESGSDEMGLALGNTAGVFTSGPVPFSVTPSTALAVGVEFTVETHGELFQQAGNQLMPWAFQANANEFLFSTASFAIRQVAAA